MITREWAPHYKVSHVSGPHAIWMDEEKKLFVYYHGENDVTRIASTTDGIHFQYEGVAVTTKMFDAISEASYARVFRYTLPGKDNRYIMLLMGNNGGTRRIYLAWSKDGRTWETRRSPLVDPPPGTGQIAQAWYFPWRGRHYLIYHGHLTDSFQTANLYASEIDPAFERPELLGLFYDHTTAGPDNVAQMSPCFVEANGKIYMFTNIGPRLNQKIALAVAEVNSRQPHSRSPNHDPQHPPSRSLWTDNNGHRRRNHRPTSPARIPAAAVGPAVAGQRGPIPRPSRPGHGCRGEDRHDRPACGGGEGLL